MFLFLGFTIFLLKPNHYNIFTLIWTSAISIRVTKLIFSSIKLLFISIFNRYSHSFTRLLIFMYTWSLPAILRIFIINFRYCFLQNKSRQQTTYNGLCTGWKLVLKKWEMIFFIFSLPPRFERLPGKK